MAAARTRSVLVRRAPREWDDILRKLAAESVSPARAPAGLRARAGARRIGWLRPVVLVPVGALAVSRPSMWRLFCCTNWHTSGATITLSTFFRASSKRCSFITPPSGGCRGTFAPSANYAATMLRFRARGDRVMYARALEQLESSRPAHLGRRTRRQWWFAVGRIARLLGQSRPVVPHPSGIGPSRARAGSGVGGIRTIRPARTRVQLFNR